VFRDAAATLRGKDIDAFLRAMGRLAGPPWQAKHKLAAAAALAAVNRWDAAQFVERDDSSWSLQARQRRAGCPRDL